MSPDSSSLEDRLARLTRHLDPVALGRTGDNSVSGVERPVGPEGVGAVEINGGAGRYWLRGTQHNPLDPWGETILPETGTGVSGHSLRIPFDGTGEKIPIGDCLFVDCETTGLSGGVGTVPFLTAVGQLTPAGFRVDQYFLSDIAEEGGKLDALQSRFADAGALVTYNGAAFDLPLLESRFRFWRLEPGFRDMPHLDLLWPTRAIFRERIGECSLGNVEERILKFARVEDLPGSEVPAVYFEYLREGTSPRLYSVFEHNRLDVVSLFVYALWLNHRTDPDAPDLADPDDLLSLAAHWFRKRQPQAGLNALSLAETRVLGESQRARLCELRGRILKRERQFEDAHADWEMVRRIDPRRIDAAEELAKHLEHRRRDYTAALKVVDSALERLQIAAALNSGADSRDEIQRLMHRKERLLRRLAP